MKRQFLIVLLFLFFAILKAQQIILPTVDNFELSVKVSVSDTVLPSHPDRTCYVYKYTLINSPSSGQPVYIFEIPWFARYYYPPLYHYLKGDTSFSVIGHPISKRASWLDLNIKPGDTVSGFVFITKELPSISDAYAEGLDTVVFTPEVYGLPEDVAEDTLNKIYYERTPYGPGKVYKTVGPGPLPPGEWNFDSTMYFVSDSGFYHLIDRVNKCFEQNWLKERAKDHLTRMYERGLRHYQNNRVEQARKVLSQIIDYLERERGNLVFDEAFYVLYYRTKFVSEHLLEQYRNK
ncbi:hypothetical protein [Candidatus Kryptobacter tengchongensis]|uniref:Uncharacterized protein n=1 Tax=Kryptobacter tengchongensis TaxID=1643429 RepID=A0A656DD24_KRYT1|nr:hypothetical protein [Candidatus Kryptobacter tengchongensis]CUT05414.1 hypothetical protein JGI24_01679 [Candidatus Kryptobacter tengchongensis]